MNRFPKLLCFALGLVSALGFAPLSLWPLTLIALALMMQSVARAGSLKAALARGYWFGFGHFCVGLNWIAGAFAYQAVMPHWLGWIAVVVLALYIAVYPAMAAGLAWKWGRPEDEPNIKSPLFWLQSRYTLFFAAGWIVTEYLRATMFTGFAWNPLAVAFVDAPVLGGTVRTVGTYGLSGIAILIAGLIALGFRPWVNAVRAHIPDGTWPTYALGAPLMAMASALFVAWIIAMPGKSSEAVRLKGSVLPMLHVVQPNIGQQDKHNDSFDAVNFAKLETLTGVPGK